MWFGTNITFFWRDLLRKFPDSNLCLCFEKRCNTLHVWGRKQASHWLLHVLWCFPAAKGAFTGVLSHGSTIFKERGAHFHNTAIILLWLSPALTLLLCSFTAHKVIRASVLLKWFWYIGWSTIWLRPRLHQLPIFALFLWHDGRRWGQGSGVCGESLGPVLTLGIGGYGGIWRLLAASIRCFFNQMTNEGLSHWRKRWLWPLSRC